MICGKETRHIMVAELKALVAGAPKRENRYPICPNKLCYGKVSFPKYIVDQHGEVVWSRKR